jgi:CheY-like chemotaxis protein
MRALAIDDEFTALSLMVSLLSEYGDCDAATNGRQALEMFGKALVVGKPYDLLLLDIQMPEMDGLELLASISHSEKHSGATPAKKIVISAESSPHNVHVAGKYKCDAFLVKPIRRDMLRAKLSELNIIHGTPEDTEKSEGAYEDEHENVDIDNL